MHQLRLAAIAKGKKSFIIKLDVGEQEFLTEYAKYLLEYVESQTGWKYEQ
jgi:hypothetical protein